MTRPDTRMPSRHAIVPGAGIVLSCLVGLGLALLSAGVVSGTFLRHVVQIVPMIAAAGVLARRPARGDVVILAQTDSPEKVRIHTYAGMRLPGHCSSLGMGAL